MRQQYIEALVIVRKLCEKLLRARRTPWKYYIKIFFSIFMAFHVRKRSEALFRREFFSVCRVLLASFVYVFTRFSRTRRRAFR